MNSNNAQANEGTEEERAVAFCVAAYEAYTAINDAKRLARSQRSRPKAILRKLEDIEAHLDTIYAEARLRQTALQAMTRIAQELRREYDQLLDDTETAYNDGFQDALKVILDNAPGDSGILVGWLIHTLQTPSAWQTPEWERVLERLRDARRYLEAGSGE